MADVLDSDFPVGGLLPKKETGVTSFLTKYPNYDGRGITIAIFDSGVDPGAPGLQKTSDGKIKVIERFDCSGCGDVVTTTIVQPKEGIVTGLTGRKLKIPATWKNPSNNYRLGIKNAFDLYPEKLRERIQIQYKEKQWESQHKTALAEAVRQLGKIESKLTGVQNPSELEKLEKEDLEAKVDILIASDKKYTDTGPTYDCVLFHDGAKWVCCVDVTEEGDLEKCPLLGEYSITHEYAPLTTLDQLNFSMNVHDDGNILELVGLCTSHGTHVASIASACFPEIPEKNGIAPGAQIISLMIGDGRLTSMETGTALVRAMIKVMEFEKTNPVHVINMSYGEQAHWSNAGRIGDIMSEVVNKYGVVWIASAGNHGPALSTVSTPPDISQETIIGVGAYVSPDMMAAEYSMRQKLPGTPYTWSSRGPTIDGGFGVSICAPGGAITSVPNCTLRSSQLMNGTSMASPHVAGAVAVILSGLKQKGIAYSPYSVRRALENSAHLIENVEVFAQGSGLLQVDKAFEFLVNNHSEQERDVRFHISCGVSSTKGIYIRSKPYSTTHEYSVSVEPFFLKSDSVEASRKINFNMHLALVCKSPFVSHPVHLDLANMTRTFGVKVDTKDLPYGVHATKIEAFDVNNVEKGPVFKIPITVVQPEEIKGPKYNINFSTVPFKPNRIRRHFYVVPYLATWGVIKMHTNEGVGHFVVHCMQIVPKQSCKCVEFNKTMVVTSNSDSTVSFQIRGGLVLEIVVAKYWADLSEVELNYTISFHGIKPSQPSITMHAANGIHSLEVTSLQGEEIVPNMSLKNSVQILKPNEAKVSPLTSRDVLPPGRQIYELLLVYNFHLSKSAEVSPNSALLSDVLYESEFESQLWMLFDSNKQLLCCGDAYPSKYSVKLDKGDYVIKMHVRDDKKENLEKLIDIPMLLNQKLSSAVTLDVYSSYSQAIVGGKKSGGVGLSLTSNTVPFYIAPLTSDKFAPKSNNPAHYLTGFATYTNESCKKVDCYPIKYILCETGKKTVKSIDKDKNKIEEYTEAFRDLITSWLAKIDVSSATDALYEDSLKDFPDHLPLHTSYLQSIDPMEHKRQLPVLKEENYSSLNADEAKKIIGICDTALKSINQDTLLAYFAVKADLRPDAANIKSAMERQRNVLQDCLCRKGIALCKLHLLSKSGSEDSAEKSDTLNNISDVWRTLLKYVDPNDTKINAANVFYFAAWHAAIFNQYGRLLKFLTKLQEEKATSEIEDKYIEVCSLNRWNHIASLLRRSFPSKYPSAYKPF